MTFTLKAIPLLVLLTISSSMAATVNLGSVLNLHDGSRATDYSVTILSVRTTARVSENNPKTFGQWRNCFTRYENSPPLPMKKYVYYPFSLDKDSSDLVSADEYALNLNDALIADLNQVSNDLIQKTEGKCKFDAATRIEFQIEMKKTKMVINSEVWISKTPNSMSVTYAKWVGGNVGFSSITESLPNKTPVQMTTY